MHLHKRRFSFLKLTPYCLGMTLVVMVVVSVIVLVYCATRYKNTYHIVNATGSLNHLEIQKSANETLLVKH
ncbi:hypothetical protein C0J52_21008 [Blattella germanica]|nr:hypothetical protein C0J52_21008 [Blattella germanica]